MAVGFTATVSNDLHCKQFCILAIAEWLPATFDSNGLGQLQEFFRRQFPTTAVAAQCAIANIRREVRCCRMFLGIHPREQANKHRFSRQELRWFRNSRVGSRRTSLGLIFSRCIQARTGVTFHAGLGRAAEELPVVPGSSIHHHVRVLPCRGGII